MWALVTYVDSEFEADVVVGLLEQEGIPTKKAYPGISNFRDSYGLVKGVEIYVPEECRQLAKDIINAEAELPEIEDNEVEKPQKGFPFLRWFLIGVIVYYIVKVSFSF